MTSEVALRERLADAYFQEAELLDAQDLEGWSGWLHADFRYEVPIPVFDADLSAPRHSANGLLAVETRSSIELWAQRLSADLVSSAYAENPPARTRHFVTNIRVGAPDEHDRVAVSSNVLLVWSDWNKAPQLVSGERRDVVEVNRELLLVHRRVLLDSAVVRIGHLRVVI
jgi:3-phenylpropionate/cinnamic acid dioxygenase small subunit